MTNLLKYGDYVVKMFGKSVFHGFVLKEVEHGKFKVAFFFPFSCTEVVEYHKLSSVEVPTKFIQERMNAEKAFRKGLYEVCLDLALATKDKEWFDEIQKGV